MNLTEFHQKLSDAPLCFRRELRNYLRHPTDRNACYITGYVAALEESRLFKTDDAAGYWVAVIGRAEENAAMCRELLAELANPPVEDVKNGKEPGIEDLEHENRLLRARNDRLERSALQDEALLRQALEALEQIARDLPRGLTGLQADTIAALRERLGGEKGEKD